MESVALLRRCLIGGELTKLSAIITIIMMSTAQTNQTQLVIVINMRIMWTRRVKKCHTI